MQSEFTMPKVELHLHLEGAAPPALIQQMAHEKKVDIKGIFDQNGHYVFRDFTHFLAVYEAATSVLTQPLDFYRLTRAVLEQSAAHGVIYTEAFLSPDFCGQAELGPWREYLFAIQEAAADAEKSFGIVMKGIVTCIRHFGPQKAKKASLCAAETAGDFICGFGMGGAETFGVQSDYLYSFDMAREAGLRITTHAGEWGGPESVRQAVFDLNAERLGHGVQVAEDPHLVDELIARDITLEVCPGSNVALKIYPDIRSHPIAKLRDRGVKVTVSTDDPPFFHTDMTKEYAALSHAFGWGKEDFSSLNKTAIKAAFCDTATKDTIIKRLDAE